ncbi:MULTISPECIES: restriction endonuclease subunit S [unclassified Pseudoalteromonas]|uniref:restriction endonuclease subunit S n=1 Tax=unclassified Pseudoalteromonas TaxID=194690 RepID=UPI003320A6C2
MDNKALIAALGFKPKEGAKGVHSKCYTKADNYVLEVDFDNGFFEYGDLITADNKATQNLLQHENWVVLECVDRLLEKGYKPHNIILEKTWPSGHGTSGRLDILVTNDDGKAFLMIECKTSGIEFLKANNKMLKDGGQLFTYYQLDRDADFLMLYTSCLNGKSITYQNQIIKIEDDYRQTSNSKELYEVWSKLPKDNGIFDPWVAPYHFESKALTPESLVEITQEDSSKIFNRFLEILRHNVVSDKPNAFNKIFTLFLCKIYDEKSTLPGTELRFQWLEGKDNNISFQKRLTDLYGKGMSEFLSKKVTDFSESDFDDKFGNTFNDDQKKELLEEFTRIRLMKNNEFAIKEVFDIESFQDNGKVIKEVVELLQGYKIRYTKKQQYLSDFFELLLTTGLKQESGQFFTPVPVAQFIIRSLPIDSMINDKLNAGEADNLLPTIIDYAAGSGHFLTESMHVIQDIINDKNDNDYIDATARKIRNWKNDHFDWADQYVYGIEKDYRLVKVGKVGCYLHGDGIANVVHSDGLGNFTRTKEYTGKLSLVDESNKQDNRQFDIVISNPPYSVSAFRNNAHKYYSEKDFELYNYLTEQSSEIECLFIERAKQLLKDDGVAGIILPSSILSNAGIYAKTREIIFRYFEVIAIAELGSNTFMATGTNTVTLFLRRRKNRFAKDIENSVGSFSQSFQDITINGIETPITKYVSHVWDGIAFTDYCSIFQKTPNATIKSHDIYMEYVKKIPAKNDNALIKEIIKREKEKLIYFIIAYPQKVVLVKSGDKKEEKAFLGYEFSNRRGSEGIHPIQRGKSIDDCTKLYDAVRFDNSEKASTYIYEAFKCDLSRDIDKKLSQNIFRTNLVDLLNFERSDFDKSLSLTVKKKAKIDSKWDIFSIQQLMMVVRGASPRPIKEFITDDPNGVNWIKIGDVKSSSKFISSTKEKITLEGSKKSRLVNKGDFILSNSMSYGRPYIMNTTGCIHDGWLLLSDFSKDLNKDYLYYILSSPLVQDQFIDLASGGTTVNNLNIERVNSVKIPLPPTLIQEKIISEISILEEQEIKIVKDIQRANLDIENSFIEASKLAKKKVRLSNSDIFDISIGKRVLSKEVNEEKGKLPVFSANVFEPFGYINKELINNFDNPSILWGIDGDWMVNYRPENQPFYPTDHCGVIRVKSDEVSPKYIAWALNEAGKEVNFSRNYRASMDRIKGLVISIPSQADQKVLVRNINNIENKIAVLKGKLKSFPSKKETILNKYL